MRRLSVLHVSPAPPQLGGMEALMGNLLKSSLTRRHDILLLNISKPRLFRSSAYAIKTGYAGAFKRALSTTATSYAYSIRFFLRFIFMLLSRRIDIVHIHTASYTSFWEKCAYIITAAAAHRKVVLHVHGALFKEFYEGSPPVLQSAIRYFFKKCDAVIALSDSRRRYFAGWGIGDKVHVVENGIDISPFAGMKKKYDPPTFLHIGEVSRRKGIYDLIEAAARVKKKGYDFHIDVVGPGELHAIQSEAAKQDVADVITLYGPKRGEEKYPFFERASCFVLASYGEGLPIAILEALAAGLPIISTLVGGIPDVIEHGKHGFLCEPGNIGQLERAMTALLEDREKREEMAATNARYARDVFSVERCAEKISAIYMQLAGSAG